MEVVDVRAKALEALKQLGLRPGYYWVRAGVGADECWVPVELDADGLVWQFAESAPVVVSSLIKFGPRIEAPA